MGGCLGPKWNIECNSDPGTQQLPPGSRTRCCIPPGWSPHSRATSPRNDCVEQGHKGTMSQPGSLDDLCCLLNLTFLGINTQAHPVTEPTFRFASFFSSQLLAAGRLCPPRSAEINLGEPSNWPGPNNLFEKGLKRPEMPFLKFLGTNRQSQPSCIGIFPRFSATPG